MSDELAYCSWCFEKTTFTRVQYNYLSRNLYQCDHCGRHVSQCVALGCENYACNCEIPLKDKQGKVVFKKGKKVMLEEYHDFCAEHRGIVADFETVKARIANPADYKKVYESSKTNYVKWSKIALMTFSMMTVTATTFWFAGPTIGAFIGSLMGLSGAAAVSAGLAFLGGGALAAGGFGMFGGMIVITVSGAATGGVLGGLIGKAYFGDIEDFDILRKGNGASEVIKSAIITVDKNGLALITQQEEVMKPAIITVDGFLTQKDSFNGLDWEHLVKAKFPRHTWYHVKWESKRNFDIGSSVINITGSTTLLSIILSVAKKGTRKAPFLGGPVAAIISAAQLANNPWHVAMVKSEKTGVLLADILKRSITGQPFVLVGHSLGCRVIYSALETLSKATDSQGKPTEPIIENVHLLGGAVGTKTTTETVTNEELEEERKKETEEKGHSDIVSEQKVTVGAEWESAKKAVKGKIYNYFSKKDEVLKYLFKVGTFFASQPIGRNEIPAEGIENVDVTDIVKSHFDFKPRSDDFVRT